MDLGDAKITVGVQDDASKKLDAIGGKMQGMSKTFQKTGLAMMGAGVALGGGLIALAKTAANFEGAMREVNTMIGLTEVEFQSLSDEVMKVSSAVGKSAGELSGALYQIVSAGVDAADAIMVLEVASKAAVAGVTDVETAADGLTTVLNAFKIPAQDAGKVADIMFTVVKRGKTNFEELSASIFNVAPIAANAGVKFEEVAAAIATVTKQGVPTTVATTQLRAAIQAIIKPTAEMSKAVERLGYESGQALIAEQGLQGSIDLLRGAAGGSLEELGKMFGSVEGLGAILSLTGENAATFADDLKATSEDASGSVESAYEEMNKGVGRQFEILFNDIKNLGIEIGEALLPILKEIVEWLKPIITNFKDWVIANKDLFPTLLKLAGVLLAAGGVIFAIAQVAKVLAAVNIALTLFHALSGPSGWIMLAGAAAAYLGALKLFGIGPFAEGGIFGPKEDTGGYKYKTKEELMEQGGYSESEAVMILKRRGVEEYASGGIVPGPIGQPVPVIAHGGEQFAGVGKSMGTTINLYVEGSVVTEHDLVTSLRRAFILTGERESTTGFV